MTKDPESLQDVHVFEREEKPLYGHPFDSDCKSMQHDGPGNIKFEDHYPNNRLITFS